MRAEARTPKIFIYFLEFPRSLGWFSRLRFLEGIISGVRAGPAASSLIKAVAGQATGTAMSENPGSLLR